MFDIFAKKCGIKNFVKTLLPLLSKSDKLEKRQPLLSPDSGSAEQLGV